jgi:hypothetical protein
LVRSAVSTPHVAQIQIMTPLCRENPAAASPMRQRGCGRGRGSGWEDGRVILHLRAAVQELYAVSPARFTALRSELVAQARAADDKDLSKAIGSLRKPTVAAWAVNHFVREHPEAMQDFRGFALLLREAQRSLDADQLRLLGRERSRRVDELAERVEAEAEAAGQPIGAAAGAEVRETLTAFIVDEEAERSVLTGSLVKALSYSGFGSVDIEGVVAIEPSAVEEESAGLAATPAIDLDERRRARAAAERARLAAAVDRARRALDGAEHHVEILAARREEASAGIDDLERQLATARKRLEKVTAEHDEASGIRDSLRADLEQAEAALGRHDAG